MNNSIAIITARGGSKRMPGKNIRDFLGAPIISYTITAALKSGCFSEVMVSTDDQRIAEIARFYGASVPFLRSAGTAGDLSPMADVVLEVLDKYEAMGRIFSTFCCLLPTAPFVTAEKLRSAVEKMEHPGVGSVIPVVKFGFPILRSFKIEDGKLQMNWPAHMHTRSQDLPPAYHDSGQFYFVRTKIFRKEKKLFTNHALPIILPESEVQDIDTEEDWKIAELKYQLLQRHGRDH
jgi:N-acylneuraminate cytidylyltransferase